MLTRAMTSASSALIQVALVSSCAPDVAQTDGGTVTLSGDTGSTDQPTGGSTGGSTGTPEPCSRVHEGDLYILKDTDLASLADLGRVTGNLTISMGARDQRDLKFLSCLRTLDLSLAIQYNELLESTEGLSDLQMSESILIATNPNLRTVESFDKVANLSGLTMYENPALEEISLDSIKSVGFLTVGYCNGAMAAAEHLALTELTGFSGLTTVTRLTIEGNEALLSADVLDAIAINGALDAVEFASIRFNPVLSEVTVHAQLDAIGVQAREVCGNAEGDPECYCPVPD